MKQLVNILNSLTKLGNALRAIDELQHIQDAEKVNMDDYHSITLNNRYREPNPYDEAAIFDALYDYEWICNGDHKPMPDIVTQAHNDEEYFSSTMDACYACLLISLHEAIKQCKYSIYNDRWDSDVLYIKKSDIPEIMTIFITMLAVANIYE